MTVRIYCDYENCDSWRVEEDNPGFLIVIDGPETLEFCCQYCLCMYYATAEKPTMI